MKEMPKTPAWEAVAIILSILALWPKIYAPDLLVSNVLVGAALAAMVLVFVRKVRRFRKIWDRREKE